jgi:hypothetical protein
LKFKKLTRRSHTLVDLETTELGSITIMLLLKQINNQIIILKSMRELFKLTSIKPNQQL